MLASKQTEPATATAASREEENPNRERERERERETLTLVAVLFWAALIDGFATRAILSQGLCASQPAVDLNILFQRERNVTRTIAGVQFC